MSDSAPSTTATADLRPGPTTASAPSPADTGSKMSHRQVLEALSGILLGMFVSVLATSIVSSSLPKIISELNGSQSAFTWVVTATLLTTTISTPVWGKLADLLNRKLLIQLALVISVVGAGLAGLSQNTTELITFRALQGVGAGGLVALGAVLIADIISPRERGRYMGLMGAVMGIAMVGGPLLGGFLTDGFGWRWNFFVGVPFAIAAILVLQRTLRLPPRERQRVRIDYAGISLISAGVGLLLVWVTLAGTNFDWVSWQTAAMVGGSLVLLAIAVLVELRISEPLIPLQLFANHTLVVAVVASAAVGVAMFGSSVFLSQYMQLARGYTPTASGLASIPLVVGLFGASTVSGNIISATGRYKRIMLVGAGLLTVGLLLMSTLSYQTPLALICVYLLVIGCGVGMLMQNLVLATQNTLDIHDVGSGTSLVAFFRTLGGAIGVSALGAALGSRVTSGITDGLAGLGISPGTTGLSGGIPDLSTLPAPIRTVVEDAYGHGVAEIFLIAAPIAVIALIAVLFLKEVPLGTRSGIEQRMASEADADELPSDDKAAEDASARDDSTVVAVQVRL